MACHFRFNPRFFHAGTFTYGKWLGRAFLPRYKKVTAARRLLPFLMGKRSKLFHSMEVSLCPVLTGG